MKKYINTFLVTLSLFYLVLPMGTIHALAGGMSTQKATRDDKQEQEINRKHRSQNDITLSSDSTDLTRNKSRVVEGANPELQWNYLTSAEKNTLKLHPDLVQSAGAGVIGWSIAGAIFIMVIWMESVYLNNSPED